MLRGYFKKSADVSVWEKKLNCPLLHFHKASQVMLVVKNLPAIAGDIRESGSIQGSRRYPRGSHGKPLQYSCMDDPMGRGACWAIKSMVSDMTEWLSMHTPFWGKQSALLSLPILQLISYKKTFWDIPRETFDALPGHPKGQSSGNRIDHHNWWGEAGMYRHLQFSVYKQCWVFIFST